MAIRRAGLSPGGIYGFTGPWFLHFSVSPLCLLLLSSFSAKSIEKNSQEKLYIVLKALNLKETEGNFMTALLEMLIGLPWVLWASLSNCCGWEVRNTLIGQDWVKWPP